VTDGQVIEEVRRVFGDVGALAQRLEADRRRPPISPLGVPESQDVFAQASRRQRAQAVRAGIDGLVKLAEGRDDDIDDRERFGLTAIILLEGRPAILIQDGDFPDPPEAWSRLGEARDRIRAVIARSGRIEVTGHLDLEWVGTASLVGSTTLMTNRHVAHEFCARRGRGWAFHPGVTSRIDFLGELDREATLEFEITGIIGIHEKHDLALLRVEAATTGGHVLPEPLSVAASEPEDLFDRDVYVVGYPALDSRRNEPDAIRRIFLDIYDVKRLQPGRTVGYATAYGAIEHDCSTLGGNSGSPVVDLETHEVVGLHFGGRYGVGNYAVPLWTLRADALLAKGDVNFA
jgi:hypothetical protein